ncbi:C-X-C chemokine receptor type 5 [Parambassis ranga]|uniref:C-X-C chemokine receptor type 5 n=1 Tax=Parambassis ranga TaxID=210632 RepID=A0A6P7JFV6_9TELE|nr:C-X-C chemokine receptor type 5 [Parambassis ranga]
MAVTNTFTVFEISDEDIDNLTYTADTNSSFFCDETDLDLQSFYTVFQPVLYSLIFLLGVTGNGLMITVLLTRRRQLRITEIYLLHLALADLMLLFTIPFAVVENITGWIFGDFLCQMKGLLKNLNLLCGSLLLACIGFDRYLAIVHAVPSMQSRRPRIVHLTCAVLWLICFGLSMPNAVFLSAAKEHADSTALLCYYYRYGVDAHNWVLTNRVLHNFCFFVPLAIMSYCYTALGITLYKSQKSQAKKGAIRLALLVTLVFCLCWLPYNITLLISSMVDLEIIRYTNCQSFMLLEPVLDVTESMGISHCCLNPFLYAFVGMRFRNELLQLLCRLGCSRICLPFIRAQGHYRASTSDGVTTTSAAPN